MIASRLSTIKVKRSGCKRENKLKKANRGLNREVKKGVRNESAQPSLSPADGGLRKQFANRWLTQLSLPEVSLDQLYWIPHAGAVQSSEKQAFFLWIRRSDNYTLCSNCTELM